MLLRNRLAILLLLVIPAVFLGIVDLTSSNRPMPFRLASLPESPMITVPEEGINFVFFAVASVGFLVAFLALSLIQKNRRASRRLILCGYSPAEILMAKLITLLSVILIISIYVGLLTYSLTEIQHLHKFIIGLLSIGFVYGCYGLLAGTLIRGELEGILVIVLLVNIDVGWLQNPLFYEGAQHQELIRYLPAYFSSQAAVISALTDYDIAKNLLSAFAYGSIFLLLSQFIYYKTMKPHR
jgi:hypothetical protein